MHNFYSSRSTTDFKYPTTTPTYDYSFKYPQYNTLRPKTQYDSIDYDYLGNKDMLLERTQLYRQLHEQKLYNQRSKLIIEDLLLSSQSGSKNKKTLAQEIVINKMNPKTQHQYMKNKISSDRQYLQDRDRDREKYYRPLPAQTDRKSSPNKSRQHLQVEKGRNVRYQSNDRKNKNYNVGGNQGNQLSLLQKKQQINSTTITTPTPTPTTRLQILKKLYQQPQKKTTQKQSPSSPSPSPSPSSSYLNNTTINNKSPQKQFLQKQQKITETQILKDEVKFLKDQLNEKNKDIVQLQCQIIRLKGLEKTVNQLLAKQVERQRQIQKQRPRDRIIQKVCENQVLVSQLQLLERYKQRKINKLNLNKKILQVTIKSRTKNQPKLSTCNTSSLSIKQPQTQLNQPNSQQKPQKLLSKCSSLNLSIQRPIQVFKLLQKCNKNVQSIQPILKCQQSTNVESIVIEDKEIQTRFVEMVQIGTQGQIQVQRYKQKQLDSKQKQYNNFKVDSQFSLHFQSKNLASSIEEAVQISQQQFQLNLSESQQPRRQQVTTPSNHQNKPIMPTTQTQNSAIQYEQEQVQQKLLEIKQDQSLILQSWEKIPIEQGVQTQPVLPPVEVPPTTTVPTLTTAITANAQSQTSENYYDFIERTYLDWMFEQDYKKIQERKAKQSQQKKVKSEII